MVRVSHLRRSHEQRLAAQEPEEPWRSLSMVFPAEERPCKGPEAWGDAGLTASSVLWYLLFLRRSQWVGAHRVRGEALSLPSLAPLKASRQMGSLASVACSHLQDQGTGQLGSPRHQPLDQPLVLECVGD